MYAGPCTVMQGSRGFSSRISSIFNVLGINHPCSLITLIFHPLGFFHFRIDSPTRQSLVFVSSCLIWFWSMVRVESIATLVYLSTIISQSISFVSCFLRHSHSLSLSIVRFLCGDNSHHSHSFHPQRQGDTRTTRRND